VWLNESFATWASIKVSDKVMPEWDIDVVRAERMGGTMGVDSLITARQIRQPIESRDDILGAFDAISYGKGSAVLSMFERWVGEDKFRDGIRAYLREHADKTATSADFLAAISAVSRPEVSPAVRTFLDQPGVPLVSMALSCERGAAPKLTLSQERFLPAGSKGSTAQTWHIPICVEYGVGRDAKRQCTLLTEARAELALDTRTCPRWVQGNADAAGYYHVAYPAGMIGALLGKAKRHQSIAEQIGVISDARAQVAAGKASIGESLALVPTLMRDKNHHIVLAAVQLAARVDREMIPNALRANHARFIRKMFGARARKLGWTPGKRDSDHTRELRQNLVPLVADVGADRRLIQRAIALTETWLTTRKGVDSSLLGAVLVTAARNGGADMHAKLFAALEGTQDKRERNAITTAVAATTEPALINKNLDWFLTSDRDIFEMFAILQVPLSRSETRQQVYDWIKANYEGLTGKLPRMAHRFIVYSAAAFCDDAHYKDTKAFFEPKLSHIPGGPRALAQTLEGIQLCMGYRAAQQANIEAFLRKY
jgi:alanyl aminopeptidase